MNHGISASAASSKKILNFFDMLIEINDKEIKFQIIEKARWLIQLSGKEQFAFSISCQNTFVKIWSMDKESTPTLGIFFQKMVIIWLKK